MLCGPWIDSRGQVVSVISSDSFQVRLRATLTTARGHKTDLPLFAIGQGCGWQCGSACLVAVSDQQLWWQFPNGSVSLWERGLKSHFAHETFHREESWSQSSLDRGQFGSPEEDTEFTLSGCQSPIEAFFNPHPDRACNSTVTFFPECFQATDQSSFSGGSDFGPFDAVLPGNAEQGAVLEKESLTGRVWQKARHVFGCREVQEALSNGDNQIRAGIASEMRGHVWDAVESPNANHVVQKCIVVMSPDASQSIIDELTSRNGAAMCLAKHRYGCRIFERLLEHCRPEQLRTMVGEVLAEAESLCFHPFGNFVLQHLFEYGGDEDRRLLALAVLIHVPKLSADPRGAAVVAKGLQFAPAEERQALARALLRAPQQLVQLATQRCGLAVALALIRMKEPEGAEARKCLEKKHARQVLSSSRHGRVLMTEFND